MLDVILEEFQFSSLWNAGIFLFLAFTAIIYLFLLPQEKEHSIWKTIMFLMGLVIIFIAAGSPLNIIGRIQFCSHIIQVILLCFVAPPFLLIGLKWKLIYRLLDIRIMNRILHFITKPYFTLVAFFLFLYAYHHPPIFDQARIDLYLNYFYLLGLFITALLLWIPILYGQMNRKMNQIYHLVCMLLILPLAIILMASDGVLYQAYTDLTTFTQALEVCLPAGYTLSPEDVLLLLPFEPVKEQHIGGIIWLLASLIIFTTSYFLKKNVYSN
jgi:putative membrane protein